MSGKTSEREDFARGDVSSSPSSRVNERFVCFRTVLCSEALGHAEVFCLESSAGRQNIGHEKSLAPSFESEEAYPVGCVEPIESAGTILQLE